MVGSTEMLRTGSAHACLCVPLSRVHTVPRTSWKALQFVFLSRAGPLRANPGVYSYLWLNPSASCAWTCCTLSVGLCGPSGAQCSSCPKFFQSALELGAVGHVLPDAS